MKSLYKLPFVVYLYLFMAVSQIFIGLTRVNKPFELDHLLFRGASITISLMAILAPALALTGWWLTANGRGWTKYTGLYTTLVADIFAFSGMLAVFFLRLDIDWKFNQIGYRVTSLFILGSIVTYLAVRVASDIHAIRANRRRIIHEIAETL